MPKRKISVKKHPRTLPSGKTISVRKHPREIEKKGKFVYSSESIKKQIEEQTDEQTEESDIDKKIKEYVEEHFRYLPEEEKTKIIELATDKSLKDLQYFKSVYKNKLDKQGKLIDEKKAKGEEVPLIDYIDSSTYHDLHTKYFYAFWLKKSINSWKKKEREKKAMKFIEKYPPHNYGMDYPPLENKVEQIIKRQSYKIPDEYKEEYDPVGKIMLNIMIREGNIEDNLNRDLPYIHYQTDIQSDIRYENTDVKISDVPNHPWADRKEVLRQADEIEKELKERGYDITKEEKKELKEILKSYIKKSEI